MTRHCPTVDLVVAEGIQQGARFSLENLLAVTVGIRLDCDVVLEPQSLAIAGGITSGNEPVMRLTCDGLEVRLEILCGEVYMGQTRMGVGESSLLSPGTLVRVGHSAFVLETVQSDAADVELTTGDRNTMQSFMSVDSAVDPTSSVPVAKKVPLGALALSCFAILGVLLVVTGVIEYSGFNKEIAVSESALPDIAALLHVEGFDQITVEQQPEGAAVIKGFVGDRSQLSQLTNLVGAFAARVNVDVVVGEELQESVASVYRLHSVPAEVEIASDGRVSVHTALADVSKLDAIEQRVQQDVTGLTQLDRINTPPEVIAEKPQANAIPGKRIVLVVASEPAYILTEDGSRYFPGSVLPNGYRVEAIQNQKVDLVRNDEHLELIF